MNDTTATKLPRRDYILIPLLSLGTALGMAAIAEATSRIFWPDNSLDACVLPDGHHKPNCSAPLNTMEGPAYIESYNECGYRTQASCGPKPPGHIRIALLGSSFAMAFGVSYEQGFPGKAERQLTSACRHPVEIQNLSSPNLQPLQIYHLVDEALSLKPDLLIVNINPMDLDQNYTDQEIRDRDQPVAMQRKETPRSTVGRILKYVQDNVTFVLVAQHYRFLDQDDYIRHYLQYGDSADFLRQPFTDAWARRFSQLDILLGDIADRAHSKAVPVALIPGLQRAQAGLMSESNRPAGVDPFAFERELAAIAARHGIVNIDPDPEFRRTPNAASLFYPVNGHFNERGNTVFQQALTRGLLSSNLAIFQNCSKASPQ